MTRVVRSKEEIDKDIESGSKLCPVCKNRKEFCEYNKDRSAPDGVVKVCKDCINRIRYNGRRRPSEEEYECNLRTKTKVCTVCKKRLPFSSYHNSSVTKDGKGYRCIKCDIQARVDYRERNKGRVRVKNRITDILCKYNLSHDELLAMLDSRRGCCDICGETLVDPRDNKNYAVDHNHDTKEVRGLLCLHCNSMLGQAKDSPSILLAGYNYLLTNGFYGVK